MAEGSENIRVMLIDSEAVHYASINYSVLGKTCIQKTPVLRKPHGALRCTLIGRCSSFSTGID